ncbi:MAG: cytochrome ubiquinol oxidase subunit I, partial [Nitrospinota bacterium]
YMLLRDPHNLFHRHALAIALAIGGIMALLQPLSGDFLGKQVARYQPAKLAALEGQWETRRGAPLRIGGWPDVQAEETRYALEIPYGLSILAFGDPQAEVQGLKEFPPEDRPPVVIVHLAFQVMVAAGLVMLGVGMVGGWLAWRHQRLPDSRWYLWLVVGCGPLGLLAVETGWIVTEVGRQPWIIYGVMRTAEAVTPMPGLVVPFSFFTALFLFLAVATLFLLRRQVFEPVPLPSSPQQETGHASA